MERRRERNGEEHPGTKYDEVSASDDRAGEFINGLADVQAELMKKKGMYFELYTSADIGMQGEMRLEDR